MPTPEIIDPDREIVDPHHHLWSFPGMDEYLLDDLLADTGTGHNIVQTIYVECHSSYRSSGERHLRPAGETAFVAAMADESERRPGATIAGIVAHADLTLPIDRLDEILDAHEAESGGRFRGIRDALSSAPPDVELLIPGDAPPDKADDPAFQRGVAHLGRRGLTYDSWHYHIQNADFLTLARAVPETTMVLDHFGTPLGVGRFAGQRDEIFEAWCRDIDEIAGCPNTVAKLGGLVMPDNGFDFSGEPDGRPGVDAFVSVMERWYLYAIDAFGPSRCMFESNFPVDKFTVDYDVFWNAAKRMAARYRPDEQDDLFAGTARRVYRLSESTI